jgi:hypothetical protein
LAGSVLKEYIPERMEKWRIATKILLIILGVLLRFYFTSITLIFTHL